MREFDDFEKTLIRRIAVLDENEAITLNFLMTELIPDVKWKFFRNNPNTIPYALTVFYQDDENFKQRVASHMKLLSISAMVLQYLHENHYIRFTKIDNSESGVNDYYELDDCNSPFSVNDSGIVNFYAKYWYYNIFASSALITLTKNNFKDASQKRHEEEMYRIEKNHQHSIEISNRAHFMSILALIITLVTLCYTIYSNEKRAEAPFHNLIHSVPILNPNSIDSNLGSSDDLNFVDTTQSTSGQQTHTEPDQ